MSLRKSAFRALGMVLLAACFPGMFYGERHALAPAGMLVANAAEVSAPVAAATDAERSWLAESMPKIWGVIQEEKQRWRQVETEAALYSSLDNAMTVMESKRILLPDTAAPGDVVLARFDAPGEVAWQGKTYPLRSFGTGYFAYLPIPIGLAPGKYTVGGLELTVRPKKFETQYLTVTKQMAGMRQDTERIQADQKKIDAARSKSQPEFLFSSAFIQPAAGRLSTPFGYTRYVNGKYDSSHTAIDLAAKEGTPVKAANDGVVGLADSLYLTGNSIYIDHGMGLFSQYAHLSELRVKAGDRVKRGEIIGLVGSTGFSTGPHLHFTFWANNVPVNPNLFFNTTPFGWLGQPPAAP
jgi:murein DD-endopeptidase MepM/ murein hydrolase activator NlpD